MTIKTLCVLIVAVVLVSLVVCSDDEDDNDCDLEETFNMFGKLLKEIEELERLTKMTLNKPRAATKLKHNCCGARGRRPCRICCPPHQVSYCVDGTKDSSLNKAHYVHYPAICKCKTYKQICDNDYD